MPKQIKKEQIKKSELIYRKWSVAGLAAAAVFMGCMAGLMSLIVKTEGAKVPTIVLFAAFIIYTAVSVVCAVLGVKSYVKDDCGVCLFQGIVHIYSVIACVMNVRMAFYNTVLSVRLAIGGRYPYRKPIAERIYTKSVCKLDMSSHCYSVLSGTWYFGGSMACEK